jgi:hypothetical protein
MLALVEFSLVVDEARVKRIGEEHGDGLLNEQLAAPFAPSLRLSLLGVPFETFRVRAPPASVSGAQIQIEVLLNLPGLGIVHGELAAVRVDVVTEHRVRVLHHRSTDYQLTFFAGPIAAGEIASCWDSRYA